MLRCFPPAELQRGVCANGGEGDRAAIGEAHERFNVSSGDNGQGKANLLEVIFAVAALRSVRTARVLSGAIVWRDTRPIRGPSS